MEFPPKAYIIGAQKAGTTSLANLLDLQDSISLSNPKEAEYFTLNFTKGLAWYRACFNGPEGSIFVDASTGYSAGPTARFPLQVGEKEDPLCGVPARIHAVSPEARFIYIVRDPIARIYSAYWHNVRAGWEKRSFRVAIEEDLSYFRTSDYAGQLKNYYALFEKESFLIVPFPAFTSNPAEIVCRCCDFLGVPYKESSLVVAEQHKNKSFQLSRGGRMLQRFAGMYGELETVVRLGRVVVPDFLHPYVEKLLTKSVPKISEEDKNYLAQRFSDSLDELADLTGIDLRLPK
jgi:hypothetical protein